MIGSRNTYAVIPDCLTSERSMTPALPIDNAEASEDPAPDTAPLMVSIDTHLSIILSTENDKKVNNLNMFLKHLRSNPCLCDSRAFHDAGTAH